MITQIIEDIPELKFNFNSGIFILKIKLHQLHRFEFKGCQPEPVEGGFRLSYTGFDKLSLTASKSLERKMQLSTSYMLRIGITGGIGSGKSTVAKVFEVLGIPVYYADDAAKRLMNYDEELKAKIQLQFGNDIYKNGQLDKKKIAEIVFTSPEKLALLNAIVHPATLKDAETWMHNQTTAYAIKEAALIFESGAHEYLDYVIGVTAPTPLRIQRTMHRDGITREEVLARLDKQMDETIKMKLCDFVIKNDEQEMLIPQVLQVHEKLLSLSRI